ncbi:MAG: ABC transporter ATP-binding protein [Spirochaetia bacterium]
MMTMVEMTGVTKSFTNGPSVLTVLHGIDVTIPAESVTVIAGASGSGKSTLLNLIGGLDRPTAGSITAAERRLDEMNEAELTGFRRDVLGFVFQFHYLLKDFTAAENIMLPAFMAGEKRADAHARALELLSEVDLVQRADHYPSQLSGGERQRVALARALINKPSLVLADEPTGNLDAGNSAVVEQLLVDLVRNHGATLIIVTHDTQLARIGDRLLELTDEGLVNG